ncbi:hypothetical protein Q0590_04935 [Rhodocytophaga aerolata]|uniref:Uncharacterized protein n=1 Tax=Rhodocytophaga aerolata TaxID=455078 RepID=A0ABT8R0F7_9BACT|nr:hypothetical protein [Rhodocytophaga aerolata]MDO1445580.1 hypothetical protein [Rhodocytophaga aerolata]
MQTFTRVLIICGLLFILGVAYVASTQGVGVSSLIDQQVVEQTKTQSGSTGRSYFLGRTVRGGGPRYGK